MIRNATLAFVALFAAASPTAAQRRPVAELDVAGVRLGASLSEVRSALLNGGYRITSIAEVQSFEQDVRREAARRRGRQLPWPRSEGVSSIVGAGPRREWLQVEFAQTRAGSEVRSVTVQVPAETMTAEAFRQQVLTKYGRPDRTRHQGSGMEWCSPEVLQVCGVSFVPNGPRDDDHPKLTAGGIGGFRLALRAGRLADAAVTRDREAAVERLAPKTDSAAF